MLSLIDDRWTTMKGGYGMPFDPIHCSYGL